MEFLTILVTLALLQLWGSGGAIQRDEWFQSIMESVATWTESPRLRLFLIIISPCILLLLFLGLVDTMLFGLFSFIVYLGVLLYSLGRGNFNENIQCYLSAWNSGNLAEAQKCALNIGGTLNAPAVEPDTDTDTDSLLDSSASASAETGNAPNEHFEESGEAASRTAGESYQSVHERVRPVILYEGYQRWFAVIFWFLTLGPVGALAYRLTHNCARGDMLSEDDRHLARQIVHYLDWIPARLLTLAFALTGNFVSSFELYWQSMWENKSVANIVEQAALAAIGDANGGKEYPDDDVSFQISGRQEILALQALLSRSAVCWVAIIALFELFA